MAENDRMKVKYKAFMYSFPAIVEDGSKNLRIVCMNFNEDHTNKLLNETFAISTEDAWKLILDILDSLANLEDELAREFITKYFYKKLQERKEINNFKKKKKRRKKEGFNDDNEEFDFE